MLTTREFLTVDFQLMYDPKVRLVKAIKLINNVPISQNRLFAQKERLGGP